jgi:iron(III) transport system substrate-binding protein
MYATSCAWTEAIGYNANLVKREDAPKSYADLLDPKWQGKMVKAHPGYSGAILTTTFLLARDLGWPYLEKLAQQKIMQVQSAADPPKKILLGERAVMADGNDYNLVLLKDQGKPVEVVYPSEGSPLIIVPSGIFRSAPNPNAARLFQSFFFSAEAQ